MGTNLISYRQPEMHTTTNHRKENLNLNVGLVVKSSVVLPGKKKLCECHSSFFIFYFMELIMKRKRNYYIPECFVFNRMVIQ